MSADSVEDALSPTSGLPRSAPGSATFALDPALVARLEARIVAGADAERVVSRSPQTGQLLANLPLSTVADVHRAMSRARQAQATWAARSARDRAKVLLRLHDLVLDRSSFGLDLIQLEAGKSRVHAYEELVDVAINARWLARRGPRLLSDERRPGLVPVLTQATTVHHPKGVVGIIAPWNYPFTLAVSDAISALLAGNAVVLKPDRQTALTALWGAELLADAGLPDGLFQIVHGAGSTIGTEIIDLADHLMFTGSTSTGRLVNQRAGSRLISTSMELGGKNALYVADDADLDRAAEGAIRDCFSNNGQLCVSIERLILHEKIADAFLERFVARISNLRMGPGLDFSHEIGSLISPDHLASVHAFVADAVHKGARVLVGGRARPDLGACFYEPTLLAGVDETMACHLEETFGPVVSVYRVGSDAEALAVANLGEYGLNGAVWTRDIARGRRLARQVRAGTVSVNEAFIASWGSVSSPMGGRGASGIGRRHGPEGLLRFTESQTVATQHKPGLTLFYSGETPRLPTIMSLLLRAARITRFPWP